MTIIRILAAVVVIGIIGAAGAYLWAVSPSTIAAVAPPDPASFDRDLVDRGEMLASAGDCVVCHTASGGQENAGGLPLPTPFGTLYSTNITPDVETGIGAWSEEAFRRAMKQGLDREGNHLYPAFPYDNFTKVTDEDIGAIYAYLMSQPAVANTPPANELPFPFSFRPVLAGWKLLFLDQTPFTPDPALNDEENRGKYLVEGLGHCGACHTPRNAFGAVKADMPMGGAEAEGWWVPPLASYSISPMPWEMDDYVNYMFDGWSEKHGIAAGPMAPIIDHLYDVDEDDVYAIAAYLAAITPEREPTMTMESAEAKDWREAERAGGENAPTDAALLRGEEMFARECSRCHKERVAESQPASLALTAAMNAPDARNFLHVVRDGIRPPLPSNQRTMTGIAMGVTDQDLIDLAAFSRWRFTDLPAWENIPGDLEDVKAMSHN